MSITPAIPPAASAPGPAEKVPVVSGARAPSLVANIGPTLRYLMTTEVHTFAFSVAANAILSFFPFVVLLLTLTRRVFRSQMMFDVVIQLLRDYLPTAQDFIVRNLKALAGAHRGGVQIFSIVMLLITSTGVFLPLEVALNKVWGFKKNRSYLGNQLISLGLATLSGVLALISIALTAGNQMMFERIYGSTNFLFRAWAFGIMKTFAIAASIAIFFFIFWLLPHGKVRARTVAPAAILTGLLWEICKYAYVLALPWLNFQDVYGPFSISVTLMFWAFLSGLLLLGGAHLSAAGGQRNEELVENAE